VADHMVFVLATIDTDFKVFGEVFRLERTGW
jgi:hypothetical protein